MASIILYFSRTGENYVAGAIRDLKKGNTEEVAEKIQRLTGAPMFRAEPAVPYSRDYSRCVEEAKNDWKRDARPELKAYPEGIEAYDTVYLGYPNYCGTMPMAMFTLLEHFDFSGKVIRPFCTHEGSGLGKSIGDIERLCPDSAVKPGLAVFGSRVKSADDEIKQWVLEEER